MVRLRTYTINKNTCRSPARQKPFSPLDEVRYVPKTDTAVASSYTKRTSAVIAKVVVTSVTALSSPFIPA